MQRQLTDSIGVNLGGWLVLEPWITPDIMTNPEIKDEFTFCQKTSAQELTNFRDAYITEVDIAWLATKGVRLVRLPVGYWLFGDHKPFMSTKKYVDALFGWAQKYDIKVLIDLHGAPGSQNGEMHSGKMGQTEWHTRQEYIDSTLGVLERIAKEYGQHEALWGIEVLNEPSAQIPVATLRTFYKRAYQLMRPLLRSEAMIVCSDSFRPWRWFLKFPAKKYPGLVFDYHHYQIFGTLDKLLPVGLQVLRARCLLSAKLKLMQLRHPVVVGEWSAVLRDDKLKKLTPSKRDSVQFAFLRVQQKAFKRANVTNYYWTYKTSGTGWWNFRRHHERILY